MLDKQAKREYDQRRYEKQRAARAAARPTDSILFLSEAELAYIAGIVDGEGSIFIAAVGPHRRKTVYPIVTVAMAHFGVIDWLRARLNAGKVQWHNQTVMRQNPTYKKQYRIQLFGKRAKLLCRVLLPYLIVKAEQARLILEFPCDANSGPGIKLDGSEINKIRYNLRDRVNTLNERKNYKKVEVKPNGNE